MFICLSSKHMNVRLQNVFLKKKKALSYTNNSLDPKWRFKIQKFVTQKWLQIIVTSLRDKFVSYINNLLLLKVVIFIDWFLQNNPFSRKYWKFWLVARFCLAMKVSLLAILIVIWANSLPILWLSNYREVNV